MRTTFKRVFINGETHDIEVDIEFLEKPYHNKILVTSVKTGYSWIKTLHRNILRHFRKIEDLIDSIENVGTEPIEIGFFGSNAMCAIYEDAAKYTAIALKQAKIETLKLIGRDILYIRSLNGLNIIANYDLNYTTQQIRKSYFIKETYGKYFKPDIFNINDISDDYSIIIGYSLEEVMNLTDIQERVWVLYKDREVFTFKSSFKQGMPLKEFKDLLNPEVSNLKRILETGAVMEGCRKYNKEKEK